MPAVSSNVMVTATAQSSHSRRSIFLNRSLGVSIPGDGGTIGSDRRFAVMIAPVDTEEESDSGDFCQVASVLNAHELSGSAPVRDSASQSTNQEPLVRLYL